MNNPETRFIQRIHRRLKQLPNPPLIRKNADRFTQGWPDVLYISPQGTSLWVEYKVHPNKPTPLQQETLTMLYAYHQNIAIITQKPQTCTIYNGQTTFDDAAPWAWITHQLGYSTNANKKE